MNLAYDNSECYLASPSGKPIYKLNGIDILSGNLNKNVSDFSELSFDLNRFVDVDGELIESNGYNHVKNNMYLYLTNFGWFKIVNEPQVTYDSEREKKHVVAESVECELLQYDLIGFKVNTGEVDSLEYLADDNVGDNGLAKEYITFYNMGNPQLSLLDLILEKVRGWQIGYVDETLMNKKFTFNVESTPIHSFIRDDLQKQARCIFTFDNFHRLINVHSIENFGIDTNIYISMRNLAKNIDVSCEDRSVYTCYRVSGGDGLDNINQVNFGDSYIENLSYYMCYPYMDDSLINKYRNWQTYREGLRPSYINDSKQYNYYYSIALELKNRVPLEDLTNTWEGYSLEELIKYKAFYEASIAAIEEELGTDEEEIKKYPVWHNYVQYKDILVNIDAAIVALESGTEIEYTDWTTNTDLYGVDELSYKIEAYEEQLDVFKNYKSDFIDDNGNYRTWDSLTTDELKKYATQSEYEQKRDYYKSINDLYESFFNAYFERTVEYDSAMSNANQYLTNMQIVKNLAMIESYEDPFTDEELTTLNRLRNYTDYKNENILVTSTYDTTQEINAQEELLNDAKEQLVISSQPQISFAVDIDNLIAISEFKEWTSILDVGVFIYLELREDYKIRLRVTEISGINPFDSQENNLTISFSNMIKGIHGIDDYSYLLNNSMNASKNSIGIENNTTSTSPMVLTVDNIQLSTELLNKIANSEVFENKFENISNTTVVETDQKVNEAVANITISGGGGGNYHSLVGTNTNIFKISGIEKEIVKFNLTSTEDTTIVSILTVPFNADLDGNLVLRYYKNSSLIESQEIRQYFLSGYDVLTVCSHFPISQNETFTLKITLQAEYFESEHRKNNSRLDSIEDYINTGNYTSTEIDTTAPTITIEQEAIRSVVLGAGLVVDESWDGTLNLSDSFGVIELDNIPVVGFEDSVSISKITPNRSEISESFGFITSSMSIVGFDDELVMNEVADNYTFNTDKADKYEYDENYVLIEDLSFKLKANYEYNSQTEEIDSGSMCSVKIKTDDKASVESVVIK